MKKILFQNMRKTIMSVIFLLAVSNITLLPVWADTQKVLCMHPQAKSIDEPATEYTRDANSYCLSYIIYQKWSCPDCGARWLSENNEYTEPHSWSEAPNIHTIDRSKSTNAICYKLIVTETQKCSKCEIIKMGDISNTIILHSFQEQKGEFDGTYMYYYNVCTECGYRVFSRKLKEYEDCLHKKRLQEEI